jgi:bifunctional DNA-binding transcriptional regulator/antitoxin component of YhaV-PrlF toxin-antitoxin module
MNQQNKSFLKKNYKLTKVGDSYKITLPIDFVRGFGFEEGDILTVAIDIQNQRFIVSKEEGK